MTPDAGAVRTRCPAAPLLKGRGMEENSVRAGEWLWMAAEKLYYYVASGSLEKDGATVKSISSRAAVLEVVFSHPEGIMLKDIAREVNRTPGAVSQIIEALVQEGMVTRDVSAHDRRAIAIHPTPNGEARRNEHFNALNDVLSDVLDAADPEEREIFARILRLVATHFPRRKETTGEWRALKCPRRTAAATHEGI